MRISKTIRVIFAILCDAIRGNLRHFEAFCSQPSFTRKRNRKENRILLQLFAIAPRLIRAGKWIAQRAQHVVDFFAEQLKAEEPRTGRSARL